MQPNQYDQQPQYYSPEQGYQMIPEDQAHPVLFGGRRRPDVSFIVPIQPFPPTWGWNPWSPWCPWTPWYPWGVWGGVGGPGGIGGFGGIGGIGGIGGPGGIGGFGGW